MTKTRLKTGQTVVVISGSHKGKQGKLLQVLPRKNRAIVEGVNLVRKHERKTQDNPQGSITEREGSIHLSNLMLLERYEERGERRKQKS
ncbi:MAG TPA: 50S ribosomal protein L24 [Opitutales bacterium]|nr:50S ribosomal protein L24 [Opitutales bacterium]